jgi:endonuclease/exonuclease/phosphatase family metal-dependent hydrolase
MWETLRRLKPIFAALWLLIGDFNEVLWSFEQFSVRKWPERQMADFREVLSQCDIFDLGFTGPLWTFDNKQKGDRNVKVRLDRACASSSWSAWFPEARLIHLTSSRSDHVPILLELS